MKQLKQITPKISKTSVKLYDNFKLFPRYIFVVNIKCINSFNSKYFFFDLIAKPLCI